MTRRGVIAWTLGLTVLSHLPAQDLNEEIEKALKEAARQVAPSIVAIETSGGAETLGSGPNAVIRGRGPTTGVVVSDDGYIVTSAFNFANKPSAVFVAIPGEKERRVARIIANDHSRMLTLIKVDASGLRVPRPVPKSEIRIGQWAMALGRTVDPNPNHPPSASVGIISALNRIWGKAIQTDAKVSPANYGGPLIDIEGRVFGILVPANPFAEGDTAGVEWYDSGIGFAIPFEDVLTVLPRLKEGKDLRKGILGITAASRDLYGAPARIAMVAPDSAAAKAGLQPGDEIIEIDGKPIRNQAQMQHALGPKYVGDVISIKVRRGKEEQRFENIVLTGPMTAQAIAWLGILPKRDDPELGLAIRYVFPDSPAAKAKLKPGDRILQVGPAQLVGPTPTPGAPTPPLQAFTGREFLLRVLAFQLPGSSVRLQVKRQDAEKPEEITVQLAPMRSSIPDDLPMPSSVGKALEPPKTPPRVGLGPLGGRPPIPEGPPAPPGAPPRQPGEPRPATGRPMLTPSDAPTAPNAAERLKAEKGLLRRTNETGDREYWLFVPSNYDPQVSHGLIIWLHNRGQGGRDAEDLRDIWEELCKKYHFIILGPKSANESGWVASESEFIIATVRNVLREYTIDSQRIVAHGIGVGGQMAFYLGFQARDMIRGVATTSAVLATQPKDPLPGQRLAFFIVAGSKDPNRPEIDRSEKSLRDKQFPVEYRVIDMGKEYLDPRTLDELARWIDSLDRL
jgi:S1-C subfamily serine protease/predicted esterase